MKPIHTPLEDYIAFLGSDKGNVAVEELKSFIPVIKGEFIKIEKSLPVKLSLAARKTYLDFEVLGMELKKHLLFSGLLIEYNWEEWAEGIEIATQIRKAPNLSPLKIFKLLSMIIYMDNKNSGFLDDALKSGLVLEMLEGL
jgi:hypothetical protein